MKYFCYQTSNNDCGFASLKMLLANLNKNRSYLYLKKEKNAAYSFLDLEKIAGEHGVKLKSYRYEEDVKFNSLPKIFLAAFKGKENFHLVLVKRKRHSFSILDPDKGRYRLSKRKFFSKFAYLTLEIVSYEKKALKINLPFFLPTRYYVIEGLIEFLATLFLITSFLFLDYFENIYIPILFLTMFAILEIILSRIIVYFLKKFDRRNGTYLLKKGKIDKEKYTFYQRFKAASFVSPRKLYMSAIVVTIIIVGITFFNPMLIFGIGVLFLFSLLDYFLLLPAIKKKGDELSKKEESLFKKKGNEFIKEEQIEEIFSLSYKYLNFSNVFKYLKIFLTFVVATLLSLFFYEGSLSYIFFFFFLFTYFLSNLQTIFSYKREYASLSRDKFRFYDEFY